MVAREFMKIFESYITNCNVGLLGHNTCKNKKTVKGLILHTMKQEKNYWVKGLHTHVTLPA